MAKPRYLGLTPGQLNGAFFIVIAVALAGAGAWLFVLGGREELSGSLDETEGQLRSLSHDLGVGILGPESRLPPTDTLRPITVEQLGLTVPGLADFGAAYASFTPSAENGAQNIDTASADDFDEGGELGDLTLYGFESEFEVNYNGSAATVFGTLSVGGNAKLFLTEDGAEGYCEDIKAELSAYEGKTAGNLTILDTDMFDMDAGADQELGSEATARITREDGSFTDLWIVSADFRLGRLIASAGIVAIGPGDFEKDRLREQVRSVARTMGERIAVLFRASGSETTSGQ